MLDPVFEDIADVDEYPSEVLCEHMGKCRAKLRDVLSDMKDEAKQGLDYPIRLGELIALYLSFVDTWERIARELSRRGDEAPDRRPGLQIAEARRRIDRVLSDWADGMETGSPKKLASGGPVP